MAPCQNFKTYTCIFSQIFGEFFQFKINCKTVIYHFITTYFLVDFFQNCIKDASFPPIPRNPGPVPKCMWQLCVHIYILYFVLYKFLSKRTDMIRVIIWHFIPCTHVLGEVVGNVILSASFQNQTTKLNFAFYKIILNFQLV